MDEKVRVTNSDKERLTEHTTQRYLSIMGKEGVITDEIPHFYLGVEFPSVNFWVEIPGDKYPLYVLHESEFVRL